MRQSSIRDQASILANTVLSFAAHLYLEYQFNISLENCNVFLESFVTLCTCQGNLLKWNCELDLCATVVLEDEIRKLRTDFIQVILEKSIPKARVEDVLNHNEDLSEISSAITLDDSFLNFYSDKCLPNSYDDEMTQYH